MISDVSWLLAVVKDMAAGWNLAKFRMVKTTAEIRRQPEKNPSNLTEIDMQQSEPFVLLPHLLQHLEHRPVESDRKHVFPGNPQPLHQLSQQIWTLCAQVPRTLHLQILQR